MMSEKRLDKKCVGVMGQDVTATIKKVFFNVDPQCLLGCWVEDQEGKPLARLIHINHKDQTVELDPEPWSKDHRGTQTFILPYEQYTPRLG